MCLWVVQASFKTRGGVWVCGLGGEKGEIVAFRPESFIGRLEGTLFWAVGIGLRASLGWQVCILFSGDRPEGELSKARGIIFAVPSLPSDGSGCWGMFMSCIDI